MVIDDLDIVGVPFVPPKTDTPLIVDADAPLTFSIPSQFLQPVGRWNTKEIKAGSAVNQGQFSKDGFLNVPGESGGKEPAEYLQGFFAPECLDHDQMVTTYDSIVKRYYPRIHADRHVDSLSFCPKRTVHRKVVNVTSSSQQDITVLRCRQRGTGSSSGLLVFYYSPSIGTQESGSNNSMYIPCLMTILNCCTLYACLSVPETDIL